MQRFFVDPRAIQEGQVSFTREQSHQLAKVLRLHDGDDVLVLDGRGYCHQVCLTEVSPAYATGIITTTTMASGEPKLRLVLFQALLRGQKLDYVLQKGTELGIAAFVPVLCQRSVSRPTPAQVGSKLGRWQAIVREAAEQSGRGVLPEVHPPVAWEEACQRREGLAVLAYEGEKTQSLRGVLSAAPVPVAVSLYIGPEGGLTTEEVTYARGCGIRSVGLGDRILRAETAGVAAAAAICYEYGVMG